MIQIYVCSIVMFTFLSITASASVAVSDESEDDTAVDPKNWDKVVAMRQQTTLGSIFFTLGSMMYPVIAVGTFSADRGKTIVPLIIAGEVAKTAGLFLSGNARNVAARAVNESTTDKMNPFMFYIFGSFIAKGASYGLVMLYGILKNTSADISDRHMKITLRTGIALWIIGDVLTLINAVASSRYIKSVQKRVGRARLRTLPYYHPLTKTGGLQFMYTF